MCPLFFLFFFFFFNDTATTEIYTLSLHDALPIYLLAPRSSDDPNFAALRSRDLELVSVDRSEEHTSELQSCGHLVCRLLLEKKKKTFFFLELSCNETHNCGIAKYRP